MTTNDPKRGKLMLIDDTVYFGANLQEQLISLGFEVLFIPAPIGLEQAIDSFRPDLIFLDIDLGQFGNGIDICKKLTATRPEIPIILISASSESDIREAGIRSGAKSFIGKPLTASLLEACASPYLPASKGKSDSAEKEEAYTKLSTLRISFNKRLVLFPDGSAKAFTPLQSQILNLLVKNQGTVISMQEISEAIWGKNSIFTYESSIYNAINCLRQILSDDPSIFIRTIRSRGYRLDVDPA